MLTPKCTLALSDAQAAPMLAALGSEVRLMLFRLLLRSGAEGLSVTGLQRMSGIPPSTLGHHINALVSVGLVSQERQGRELLCRAEFADIRSLSAFLLRECCAGVSINGEAQYSLNEVSAGGQAEMV